MDAKQLVRIFFPDVKPLREAFARRLVSDNVLKFACDAELARQPLDDGAYREAIRLTKSITLSGSPLSARSSTKHIREVVARCDSDNVEFVLQRS